MRDPRASGSGRLRGWRRITPGAAFMALTAVIVAAVSARDAAVQAAANQYPGLAAKLAPANATAITRVFDATVLTSETLRQNYPQWVVAAKQALGADPLNASGIRLLAYVTELTPNGLPRARRLMLLSERASRRDMLAQVWLIEHTVQQGDVVGALKHYDRALSVQPAMASQLFPVLVSAASEPEIQEALAPYLRANRPWVPSFLSVLVAKSTDPVAVTRLFRRYGGARAVPGHAVFETTLLKRLVVAGMIREARSFAASAGAGVALDNFGFAPGTADPRFNPLTWAFYVGADGEVVQRAPDTLEITVRPETRIVAATRVILPPKVGSILRQRVYYSDGDAMPLITWKAYCRRQSGPPQQFWVRDLPTGTRPTIVESRIDAPAGCIGVQIDVEATGASGSVDSRATIGRVELTAR